MTDDAEPFFRRDGALLVPTPQARGPWNPNSMHGRVLAGLLGHTVEQRFGDAGFQFARLTVDLFRLPMMAPVSISVRPSREGNRIKVIEGVIESEGQEIARGTVVMLRRADQPEGTVWTPPAWDVPRPDEIAAPVYRAEGGPPPVIPSRAGRDNGGAEGEEPQAPSPSATAPPPFRPMWETRPITGSGFGGVEQKRAWIRESRLLVAGEPLTPFVRAALAADYTNPFANSGDRGLNFVNADITLYLHRLPQTEWIGFEVASHQSEEGIAVGECNLYDERGAIGHALVCGVANSRAR
ncbi:MAG TPA: thioesterase family protein [Dehalococcoidia bacterium]